MKAIGLNAYGGPDVLHLLDLPEPHAGPGEVRLAVRAAAVNPVDAMLRTGLLAARFPDARPPFVPGMEVGGVVDEVGPQVEASAVPALGEDAVAFVNFEGSSGGYADFVVVPAASVTRAPRGLSLPEASSFLMNALTARHALDTLGLASGSTLWVTGAAGALGGYLTQLGARDGLRVIALASASDEETVRGFGASDFVPRGPDAVAHVRALVPQGVDAVADAAGLGDEVLPAIRDGGQLVAFRVFTGQTERDIMVHARSVRERAEDHDAIVALRELAETDQLAIRVSEVMPALDAVEAHRRLDAGGLRGRIILSFPV